MELLLRTWNNVFDAPALVSFVSELCENDIIQTESDTLKHIFAFDQQTYSQNLPCQHVSSKYHLN